eukprot:3178545-Heterocapsa_arctica.AAC.1
MLSRSRKARCEGIKAPRCHPRAVRASKHQVRGVPPLALTATRRQWATGHDVASWAMIPAGLPPLGSG